MSYESYNAVLTRKCEQTRTTLRTVRIPQELDKTLETISKKRAKVKFSYHYLVILTLGKLPQTE